MRVGRLWARLGERGPAVRDALLVLATTRALVWAAAFLSAVVLGAENASNRAEFDAPALTRPFGAVGDAVLSPLAHWDAAWYLAIADHGYGVPGHGVTGVSVAFFPLYSLLAWLGSGLGASHGLLLLVAFAISLVAFGGALYLLHRLVALELGPKLALPTIGLLALFPGALFFGIPYSESLFLLVSVGAFYAARTGRWAWAGLLGAAASATRSAGILLLVPLVLLYLYGPRADRPAAAPEPGHRLRPRHALRPDVLWLALTPLGLAGYCTYLGVKHGDAFAWAHLQDAWFRHFAGPFGGLWDGARAAWDGARQLVTGSGGPRSVNGAAVDRTREAIENIGLFGFAIAAIGATVGTFRRLPVAYGAYVVVALALPLSFPTHGQPLMSLPRFLAVLFPLFMWLALWCEQRRRTTDAAVAFAALLGLFTAQYAAWEWVA